MARVVRFYQHGGPEVLRIEQVEVPAPGAGEVQIQVRALGLNRAEALLRAGTYIETPTFPSGLGLEAAGVIVAVGDGVNGLDVGDAVSVIPPISMVRWPTYAEVINFPAAMVVRNPASLSMELAAAAWMQYLTAYGALIEVAALRPGEVVVITAASSSVGLAAIQIAKLVGAIPIAVTRTLEKKQALLDAGAAHVIALAEEDLVARVTEITESRGARVVLDPVGGRLVASLTEVMARGGMLIEYGGLSAEPTPFPLPSVLAKSLTLRGYLVHEMTGHPKRLQAARDFIEQGLATNDLRPIVAKVFPFEQIIEAHRYLESNRQVGKVVVTIAGDI